MAERHIVIVGGGFTGTALAIHLARRGAAGLQVTVIEPRPALARGVAYGTQDPAHRINVPASRMQLSAAEEGEFDRWYRASQAFPADPEAQWQDGKVYPQRGQFGAYIAEQFAKAAEHSPVKLTHVRDHAVALRHGGVVTASGEVYQADEVVLAISHPPPAVPKAVARALGQHPALIANPWRADALAAVKPQDSVAIIGTGLTMSDVVASLHRQGHRGKVLAFSRRGQLPRPNLSGDFPLWTLDYQRPQAEGRLQVLSARLQQVSAEGEQVRLTLQPRGAAAQSLLVDKIIVTTGPAHGALLESDALLQQLAADGLIQADPLALGILVNGRSQTVNLTGEANPHLHVVGPAARGRFGELMGLPQVAEHAESLANQLLEPQSLSAHGRCPASLKTC